MIDTNKTKAFDIIASVICFENNFKSYLSIIDGINAPYHYVAIYRYTIKTAQSRIWKLEFRHEPRQKIVLTEFETA